MSTLQFKCPCCGAELIFSSQFQKMNCEYCGTELDIEAVSALADSDTTVSEMNWSDVRPEPYDPEGDVCTYTCSSCGAEITGDRSLGATTCPYCDSPFVVEEKFSGMSKPDLIIPFKIGKEEAIAQFRKFCASKKLLPGNFMNTHRIESVQGMYVPYWLFNCGTNSRFRYRAERVSHWTQGNYDVTKTEHFLLIREGKLAFDNVPVDGTSKLRGDITEAIEPFDASHASPFNAAFLSGFLADKFDVTAEESRARANERIKASVEHEFRRTTDAYTSVREEHSSISLENGRITYSLMPLWLMTAKYNGKLYTFAMNGQTGRFVGELPISWARFWGYLLGISAVSGAILYFILGLFM